jgi:hypothetical protein
MLVVGNIDGDGDCDDDDDAECLEGKNREHIFIKEDRKVNEGPKRETQDHCADCTSSHWEQTE